jgi:hypothetical protein
MNSISILILSWLINDKHASEPPHPVDTLSTNVVATTWDAVELGGIPVNGNLVRFVIGI